MNFQRPLCAITVCLGILMLLVCCPHETSAQVGGKLPKQEYYNLFFRYYQADYKNALKDFTSGANSSFKIGTSRFLDLVCYQTMMGECYYHMGNYPEAVSMYESALGVYLDYAEGNWQQRLQQPNIAPSTSAVQRAQIDWYQPQRVGTIAKLPGRFQMLFGRMDANRAFVEGGAVQNAELKPVDVGEIMRCAALAIHRRHMIKGATCKYDPFTNRLVSGLAGLGRDGTTVGKWNGILHGLAYASAGDDRNAIISLQASLQLNGGMDHQLTPIGLLTLAYIGYKNESATAAALALEASFSAGVRYQYDLVEESLSLGTKIHLAKNRSVYSPLENAIAWAARQRANFMQASLTVRLAECYSEMGDAKSSAQVLKQTRKPMSRNSLNRSVVGSRLQYVNAMNYYLVGDSARGTKTLASSLQQFQNGSRWLYQLGLADSLVVNGNVGERQADLLYQTLLRDPKDREWLTDPMESLAFLTSSHVGAMERWFDISVSRRNFAMAIEVAELVRRHRFYSSLPLGGRLLAFRWMLHAPDVAITKEGLKQRRDFFVRYPVYKQMTDQAEKVRQQLLTLPAKPDFDTPEFKKQTDLFVELLNVSNTQEDFLAALALRREPSDLVFPPQDSFADIQKRIGKRQVAIVSIATQTGYHQLAISQQSKQYLGQIQTRVMQRSVASLLKQLGLRDNGGGLDVETLRSEEWKQAANEMKQLLFGDVDDAMWKQYDEMVVVPDGVLWYLPFEVLQLGNAESGYTDITDSVKIRYSPLLALGFVPQRKAKRITRTTAVTARMHPKGDAELTAAAFEKLAVQIPDAVHISEKMRIPSNLRGAISDQLVVWSDLKPPRGGIFGLNPAHLDSGKSGSTLGSWLSLPWQGPDHVVLPGFTSGGAAGSKGRGNGQEMFQAAVGILASGSRSLLLSRWRVGGENSLELTRNYVERMKTKRPLDAWCESFAESRALELNLDNEPRVKPDRNDDSPLVADHPFFWAGHLLIEVPDDKTAAAINNAGPIPTVDLGRPQKDDDAKKADDKGEPEKGGADKEAEKMDGDKESDEATGKEDLKSKGDKETSGKKDDAVTKDKENASESQTGDKSSDR